jgi:hypothetical protein
VKSLLLVSILMTSFASPAFAADPQTPEKAKEVKEVKVCRRVVPTGSIMSIKTCRTQKDWDEMTAKGQDAARQVQDRSRSSMSGATSF